jgi:hypothetical protein
VDHLSHGEAGLFEVAAVPLRALRHLRARLTRRRRLLPMQRVRELLEEEWYSVLQLRFRRPRGGPRAQGREFVDAVAARTDLRHSTSRSAQPPEPRATCILEGAGTNPRVKDMFGRFRRTRETLEKEAAAKRSRAWVEVEQEIRMAIQAGVPSDEIGEAVATVLRKYGLESSADRVVSGSRQARNSS